MMQMTYLRESGDVKRWCKLHNRFDCACSCGAGRPRKDYSKIDRAICRVLEIYASEDNPMPPRRIQRMIQHFNIERPYIYDDLQRLEGKGHIARLTRKSGFFLLCSPIS